MNGMNDQKQAQHRLKKQAAQAAIDLIAPALQPDTVLGIGTGSTVDAFIDLLAAQCKGRFRAAVSSSERSSQRLQAHGIAVMDLDKLPLDPASGQTAPLPFYVDGADEIDDRLRMIKGGGGALTREKIVASAARQFICVVDASKRVAQLGAFPLPLEVLPLARTVVAQWLTQQGARVAVRKAGNNNAGQNFVTDFVTDNGGLILDVSGLDMSAPERLETELNNLPGVLTCGLFALRRADVALIAYPQGVDQLLACMPDQRHTLRLLECAHVQDNSAEVIARAEELWHAVQAQPHGGRDTIPPSHYVGRVAHALARAGRHLESSIWMERVQDRKILYKHRHEALRPWMELLQVYAVAAPVEAERLLRARLPGILTLTVSDIDPVSLAHILYSTARTLERCGDARQAATLYQKTLTIARKPAMPAIRQHARAGLARTRSS